MFNFSLRVFGFCNISEFSASLLKVDHIGKLLTLSSIIAGLEYIFGLNLISMIFLLLLLKIELITGIWYSRKKKRKFSSLRLNRFFLKAGVYVFFIGLFNIFKLQFEGNTIESGVYGYLHSFIIFYIIGVYSVSIWENVGGITGKKKEFGKLKKVISKKLKL